MTNDLLISIGAIIITATIFALVARVFKQPSILAYILAGVILGPVLGFITNSDVIRTLSEIGIAFLLFIVGLEIDFKKLRNVAFVSSLGAVIQMTVLFSFGFIVSLLLAFKWVEALYIGVILTFSSTMLVVKLLSDKQELDTLHGRIIIGFLLMEDFFAILALSIFSSPVLSFAPVIVSLLKFLLLLGASFLIARFVLKRLFKFAATSQELFFLASIMVLFFFALVAHILNLSIIIGSFIAGVALGNLPYNLEVIGKVKSLKDFFATIFFVSLGLEITFGSLAMIIIPLVIFTLFIMFMKPIITAFLCSFFGYQKKPSFLTGISLAETSEFSLILVTQGLILGHISQEIFSMTLLIATATMVVASYSINFDHQLFKRFARHLSIFNLFVHDTHDLEYLPKRKRDVILFGYNRIGFSILRTLRKIRKTYLVIDYNPELVKRMVQQRIPCIYGDATDPEILDRIGLDKANMVISTLPDFEDNLLIIQKTKQQNKRAAIFVTSLHVEHALQLYEAGADYVILPHLLGGEHMSVLIEKFRTNINKIIKHKLRHIEELRKRHDGRHSI